MNNRLARALATPSGATNLRLGRSPPVGIALANEVEIFLVEKLLLFPLDAAPLLLLSLFSFVGIAFLLIIFVDDEAVSDLRIDCQLAMDRE
jgi:hypothetical protein